MKKNILFFAVLLFMVCSAKSQTQKKTENLQQIWVGYFNQTRFNNKWGLWTDLNLRTKDDFVNNFSVSIVRVGLTYYLTTDTKLTAGYAWVNFFLEITIRMFRSPNTDHGSRFNGIPNMVING